MSIRYTLRHNIPADKLRAEDVNDSSTLDLNLLRKHELAETDENHLVYRQHDGSVLDVTQEIDDRLASVANYASTCEDYTNLCENYSELCEDYKTDAENFAVADSEFTKESGDDHTTQYHSAQYYASTAQTAATTATTKASEASDSATIATSKASQASGSATIAIGAAQQIIDWLENKESLSSPIVDPTLTISEAAADAQVVGNYFNSIKEDVNSVKDVLKDLTHGHFYRILPLGCSDMVTYQDDNGTIVESSTVKACDYTLAPTNLCLSFPDSSARCYLYFYQLSNGVYSPDWTILSMSTENDSNVSDGTKNYLNNTVGGGVPTMMIEDIPAGTYFRFRSDEGDVELYGWDGVLFDGMPIASDGGYPSQNGSQRVMFRSTGGSGITISGNTDFLLSDDTYYINGISGIDTLNNYVEIENVHKKFYKFPSGYKYFRLQIDSTNVTRLGDVDNHIITIGDYSFNDVSYGRGIDIERNAKTYCDTEWIAKANVTIDNDDNSNYKFRNGVKYNGFPYTEEWKVPDFVCWHVQPHTVLNAINDVDSVFYNETSGSKEQPYYGNVCSSFATLVAGFPYPQINAGFSYDPDCLLTYSTKPTVGQPYTSLSHCFIPVGEAQFSNGDKAVIAYDGTRPASAKTIRRSMLTRALDKSAWLKASATQSDGTSWFYNYGYTVSHVDAKTSSPLAPYFDFTDTSLVNGDARPYKGDKCVYVSTNDTSNSDYYIYINIKNSATTLYLRKGTDTAVSYSVSSLNPQTLTDGTVRVSLRGKLSGTGIYYVYTDTSAIEESFEYIDSPASVTITLDTNGKIVSTSGDFWYILCFMYGSDLHPSKSQCCIPKKDDYSGWNRGGQYVSEVRAVFRKGEYGAYTVPHSITTVQPHDTTEDITAITNEEIDDIVS